LDGERAVANPNAYDEDAAHDAAVVLRVAVAALWNAGASAEEIEDEVEEAKQRAGVEH
jgi:hypothetical protein